MKELLEWQAKEKIVKLNAERCIIRIKGSMNRIEIQGDHHYIVDYSETSLFHKKEENKK